MEHGSVEWFVRGWASGRSVQELNLVQMPLPLWHLQRQRRVWKEGNGGRGSFAYLLRHKGYSEQEAYDWVNWDRAPGFVLCRYCGTFARIWAGWGRWMSMGCSNCGCGQAGLGGSFFENGAVPFRQDNDRVERNRYRMLISAVLGEGPKFLETWLTDHVVGLVGAIWEDGGWDKLPVLADALEEAGCSDPEVLGHCRGWRRMKWGYEQTSWVVRRLRNTLANITPLTEA